MSVLPFRPHNALAVIRLDGANWSIDMFGAEDCEPLGVIRFAVADEVIFYASEMQRDEWRLIYGDGASGIRVQVEGGRP